MVVSIRVVSIADRHLSLRVGFRAGNKCGVVEDTARWQSSDPLGGDHLDDDGHSENSPPMYVGTKHHAPWFAVTTTTDWATVRFTCPQCEWESKPQNADALGRALFATPTPELTPE